MIDKSGISAHGFGKELVLVQLLDFLLRFQEKLNIVGCLMNLKQLRVSIGKPFV